MSIVNNANRDVFVGEMANNVLNEKDGTLFGFAYLENAAVHYYAAASEAPAFLLQLSKMTEKVICTPIATITQKSLTIHPENQAASPLQDILQQNYPESYFAFLTYFNEAASHNSAEPILKRYLTAFPPKTARSLSQANYALVNFAYCSKRLHRAGYLELLQRIPYSPPTGLPALDRFDFQPLWGIGYFLPDHTLAYYSNAYLPNVLKKKFSLETERLIVSPVFSQSYALSEPSSPSIKGRHDHFRNLLKETLSLNYMLTLQELKRLPSPINTMAFQKCLSQATPHLTESSLRAIGFYSDMWGCP
ncbi:hypothetical protein [Desulfitobacterium chlororespirans]|uniref:Uncharacterized protein n=1 Tax=Desulfitobacterium chlororespirans DSM 11544 TaxID=1121395 RepID=A0A1M7S4B1_9FIRM|nr:hypothetical protein [Desulfitobacterium chlororespirans]SHN53281.1 hypothetical protein SAMN02745215_00516 [Desulfitobacterium chlororespirans DSM 11544]